MMGRAYVHQSLSFTSPRERAGDFIPKDERTKELTGQGPSCMMMMTGHIVVLRGLNEGGRKEGEGWSLEGTS